MEPDGAMEARLRTEGFSLVAGVDEVGRGAFAGPLVACAVILPDVYDLPGLRDSKLCSALQRERLAREIHRQAIGVAFVRVSPRVIDRRGLHRTNMWALGRAVRRLNPRPDYVLSDGFRLPRLPMPSLGIRKGDRVAASVAAASIVAKVARDRTMVRLDRRYPGYGFRRNKGYGTGEHRDAIRRLGPSPAHRRSFQGVAPVVVDVTDASEDLVSEQGALV